MVSIVVCYVFTSYIEPTTLEQYSSVHHNKKQFWLKHIHSLHQILTQYNLLKQERFCTIRYYWKNIEEIFSVTVSGILWQVSGILWQVSGILDFKQNNVLI